MNAEAKPLPHARRKVQLSGRAYQLELFELAKNNNVVVYLDTGSGKTFVSVLLIRHVYAEFTERAQQRAPFLAVFMAPTVALVEQQFGVLKSQLDLRVSRYIGAVNPDAWDATRWQEERERTDVMAMTPQILLNALARAFIRMDEVALLIFDEAHHSFEKHPYNLMMQDFYHPLPKDLRPHVFGMTASPLNTKSSMPGVVINAIRMLEQHLDATVVTVRDRVEVEKHAPVATQEVISFAALEPPHAYNEAMQRAVARLDMAHKYQKSMRDMQTAFVRLREVELAVQLDHLEIRTSAQRIGNHLQQVWDTTVELGAWSGALVLNQVLCSIGYVSTSQLYVGQQRMTAPEEEDKVDGAEERPLVTCVEPSMSLEQVQQLLTESYLHANHEVLGNSNLTFADIKDELGALCRSIREATEATLRLLLHGSPMLEEALQGVKAAYREAVSAGGSQVVLHVAAALGKAIVAAMALVTPEQLQAAVQGTDDCGVDPRAGARALVSPKAVVLAKLLQACKEGHDASIDKDDPTHHTWSCIVFVRTRMGAYAVASLLQKLPAVSWMRSAMLVGGGSDVKALDMTPEVQRRTLVRFRSGDLACLVATSVAEEGLDIQGCQLVVRLDLPDRPRSLIQSRGRARVKQSRLVMFVSSQGDVDTLKEFERSEQAMRGAMDEGLERLGRVQEVEGDEAMPQAVEQVDTANTYVVESTGARVFLHTAVQMLNNFYLSTRLRYSTVLSGLGGDQLCQAKSMVVLPTVSPVPVAEGCWMSTKDAAKASACVAAIRLLHQGKFLDDHLRPTWGRPTSNVQPAAEEVPDELRGGALTRNPPRVDVCTKTPDLLQWKDTRGHHGGHGDSHQMFLHVFEHEGLPTCPWGLLLCCALPVEELPSFSMYLNPAEPTPTRVCCVTEVCLSPDELQRCKRVHHTVVANMLWRDLNGTKARLRRRGAEGLEPGSPYARRWLVPIGTSPSEATQQPDLPEWLTDDAQWPVAPKEPYYVIVPVCADIATPLTDAALCAAMDGAPSPPASPQDSMGIDWTYMSVLETGVQPLRDVLTGGDDAALCTLLQQPDAGRVLDAALTGTVVITAYNGRHFEYGAVDSRVCMTDLMDEEAPAAAEDTVPEVERANRPWSRFTGSFLDYYRTIKKLPNTWADQPLVRAGRCVCVHPQHYVMARSDCLRQRPRPSAGSGRVLHLVPQTLWLHPLTASHWHGLKHLRSAVWRLQGLLAALELRGKLVPEQSVLPRQSWPHVIDVLAAITASMAGDSHDGTGLDYERMETLGDSVLKFICCIYLYCRYPHFFEGQLSLSKHYLVSNHNLWFRGLTGLQLGQYIRAIPFAFAAIPLPGTGLPAAMWTPQQITVRGKVMGDVMEALLGGAYVRGGIWGALAVSVHLHLLPPRAFELLSAYQYQPHLTTPEDDDASPTAMDLGSTAKPTSNTANNNSDDQHTTTNTDNTANIADEDMLLSVQQQRTRAAIEQALGYRFKDPRLLFRALTHPSCHATGGSYQRLEYVGDAVLDLMIMHRACAQFLGTAPHMLSAMRDADANGERMARLTVALRLHVHLQHESPTLFRDITAFATAMDAAFRERCQLVAAPMLERLKEAKAALQRKTLVASALPQVVDALLVEVEAAVGKGVPHKQQVREHLLSWCADGAPLVMTTAAQDALESLMEPLALRLATTPTFGSALATAPKVLSDIMESLLGGVFLDSDQCLATCWHVTRRLYAGCMSTPTNCPQHPVAKLGELASSRRLQLRFVEVLTPEEEDDRSSPDSMVTLQATMGGVTVGLPGEGVSKRKARVAAAEGVLELWREDADGLVADVLARVAKAREQAEREAREAEGGEVEVQDEVLE